jgi:hypothetical protein
VAALASVVLVAVLVGGRSNGIGASGGNAATPGGSSPGGSSSAATLASPSAGPSTSASPPASPAASCVLASRLIAARATAPSTGFPIPVTWTNLGPAGDLIFSLNDVTPEIPLQPAGPVYLRVGLGYFTGGDRFAFTASSNTLAYDPATGKVSGDVATGYGKNSNRATTDAQPSRFVGVVTRPSGGANGTFTGSIAHHARTFAFRLEIAERTVQVATGPGCTATSPTDAPPAP